MLSFVLWHSAIFSTVSGVGVVGGYFSFLPILTHSVLTNYCRLDFPMGPGATEVMGVDMTRTGRACPGNKTEPLKKERGRFP